MFDVLLLSSADGLVQKQGEGVDKYIIESHFAEDALSVDRETVNCWPNRGDDDASRDFNEPGTTKATLRAIA